MDMVSKTVGGGDMLRGVIFMSIVEANIRDLKPDSPLSQAYSEAGDIVPDDLRRPVSVHALALSMGLPYETTRRHVNRLISDGLCVRRDSGVIIPGDVLARGPMVDSVKKNFEHLRDLFGELRAGGVEFDA